MITRASTSQMKNIGKLLKQAKVRNEQGLFVVEGKKMFEEARDQGHVSIEKAYVSSSYIEQYVSNERAYFQGVDYELVSDTVMKEISDTITPQGIIALIQQPKYEQKDMLYKERVRLLLLEDVRDPGNLGTMIRTSEGAGVTGIILSKNSVDIFNPKVIRSTMGSIYRMPFLYVEDFEKAVLELKKSGIAVYAAHLEGAVLYDTVDYGKKSAILIGNEANGLTKEVSKLATQCIKIPMDGQVESLNAAIAAAILMYEVKKYDN